MKTKRILLASIAVSATLTLVFTATRLDALSAFILQQMRTDNSISTNLVGHWSFDGDKMSTTQALDSTAGAKHGTFTGTTRVAGAIGQALDFNGTTHYVDIGATLQTVNSVAFWIKADDTTTRNILGLNATANINLNASSVVTATGFTTPTIYVDGVAASTIPDTGWHHVVVTTGTGISASDMDIGRFSTGYFDGSIDDVRIYSSALTADQAARLYNFGQTDADSSLTDRHTTGLNGHWSFDGNAMSGSTTGGTATNTGFVAPVTGANTTGVGTVAWSNPGNAISNNTVYATVAGNGAANWFNEDFSRRKKLTVDNTKVPGTGSLSNYPILVSFTDPDLRTSAYVTNASGYDIIFTDGSNTTQLAHEIESYNASTGAIEMWVSIPSLSGTVDTDFYMYYGNSSITTSQEDPATLWTAYEGVWHLNNNFVDSAKTHDGTNTGTVDDVGVVGRGRDFSDDSINIPDGSSTALDTSTNMTISAWVKPDAAFSSWNKYISKGDSSGTMAYELYVDTSNSGKPITAFYPTSGNIGYARSTVNMTTNDSTWYHITSVKAGTDISIYTDGNETEHWTQAMGATPRVGTHDVYFGSNYDGYSPYFNGDMDEVRIAKTNLSADWINTEYLTITTKGAGTNKFLKALPAQEVSSASVTSNYLRASNFGLAVPADATINGVEVRFERKTDSTTSTNMVKLVNASGVVQATDRSTDPSWSGTDTLETYGGAADLWGMALTPADVNDADFGFVVSANHSGSAAQNASVDYMQVKVYYTTAGASSLTAVDETGNGNDGTVTEAIPAPGQLGQALVFDGTNDYVDIGTTLQTVNSVAFWLKADDTTTRNILGLNATANINLNASSVITATGFTTPTIYVDGAVASTIPDTGWYHVVVTTGTGIAASDMDIGRFSTGYFDGAIDDVRIYSRALTADEVTRLYNLGNVTVSSGLEDRFATGLAAYWTMDGKDMSGSLTPGTPTDTGYLTAQTGANQTGVGTAAWTTPTNVTGNDGAYTTVAGAGTANWYDATYAYRKKLTIDETKVGGASNLTNYPILVSIASDANLETVANGGHVQDGNDIIFVNGTNTTKLDHEVESYTATTGALNAWVEIPTLSVTADTDIYVYYGKTSAGNQQNVAGVWGAYTGVWHFNGNYTDSAGSNDGTNNGTTSVAGMVSNGINCSAAPKYVTVPDNGSLLDNSANMTASIWIRPTAAFGGWDKILVKGQDDADGEVRGFGLEIATSPNAGKPSIFMNNTGGSPGNARSSVVMTSNGANWYNITTVKNTTDVSMFTNGSESEDWTQAFSGTPQNTTGNLNICSSSNGWGNHFKGDVDELRIAQSSLSAGWIATDYNTITLKGTGTGKFIKTVSSEETPGGEVVTNYLKGSNFGFTVPSDATVTGIEVGFERKTAGTSTTTSLVRLVNASGTIAGTDKSVGTAWTSSDIVESYGGSGDLWGLTLTPTDVNDADFGFVISATHNGTTAQNASVDYMRVKVFYTPAGTATTQVLDATANNIDSVSASGTQAIGQVGQAMSFNGTSDVVSFGDVASIDSATNLAACAWVYHDTTSDDDWILSKYNAVDNGFIFFRDDVSASSARTDIYAIYIADSADTGTARLESPTGAAAANQWNHVCFSYTANTAAGLRLFVNGAEVADSPVSTVGIGAIDAGTNVLALGAAASGASHFAGKIDDARLYTAPLTITEVERIYSMGM